VGAVRRAPGRLLAYLGITIVLGALAALIIFPLVYLATAATMALTTVGLGPEKIAKLLIALPGQLVSFLARGEIYFPYGYGYGGIPFTFNIGALIIFLVLMIIPIAIAATLFVVFPTACACSTYITVRETPKPSAVAPQPPLVPQKRYCININCRAELGPNDRFCQRCGTQQ